MVSKERLEELIEQGATIWHDDWEEIKLDKNTCEICEVKSITGKHMSWCLYFEYEWNNTKQHSNIDISEIEEDIETAKWHYENDCSRTDWFRPPTWEEFDQNGYVEFVGKDGTCFILGKSLIIDFGGEPFSDYELGITDKNDFDHKRFFSGSYTKENYIKACRKAKELFLGGGDGDIR